MGRFSVETLDRPGAVLRGNQHARHCIERQRERDALPIRRDGINRRGSKDSQLN